MHLRPGVFPVSKEDFPILVEVWEASVRATHDFISEADISFFRPIVCQELPKIQQLACVRDVQSVAAGFVAVVDHKVEMLFIKPTARGQGAGKSLLTYAVNTFEANLLDVNEQNSSAVGFYLHMGFIVVGRSEFDGFGKPYPLLHMRLSKSGDFYAKMLRRS